MSLPIKQPQNRPSPNRKRGKPGLRMQGCVLFRLKKAIGHLVAPELIPPDKLNEAQLANYIKRGDYVVTPLLRNPQDVIRNRHFVAAPQHIVAPVDRTLLLIGRILSL